MRVSHFALPLALGAALSAVGYGCNSPTLPLPPPAESVEVTQEGSFAIVSGPRFAVEPYALVTAYNDRTRSGTVAQANADGVFSLRIEALPGDAIELWQRVGNSPPAIVVKVPSTP